MIRLFSSLFKKMMTFDTTNIENLLETADIDFSAAFSHGVLTAYCCSKTNDDSWAITLQPDIDVNDEQQKTAFQELKNLKQHIHKALQDSDLSFQPLFLDSESASIREQSLSTREWVSGFWLGLQQAGLVEAITDESSKDFLKDMRHIASMPLLDDDDSENLTDLMEVQEYCRMGVLSLFLTMS